MCIQIGTHQFGGLRPGEEWIGISPCRPTVSREGQIRHWRKRHCSNKRLTARSIGCCKIHEQLKRQVSASGVTRNGDLREASLDQTEIAGSDVFSSCRKWMFRGKPVIGHEGRYAGTDSDMSCQMTKRLCGAPAEPSAMEVHHRLAGPRVFGSAPPSRNASNMVSLVDYADRGRDVLHDRVERNPSCNPLKLTFVGFHTGAHGGHGF